MRRLLMLVAAFAALPALAADFVGEASVIDGDTIEINGQRIELYGIDAPEQGQPCWRDDNTRWNCGADAANALANFVMGQTVHCAQVDTDLHGHVVAVCSVGDIDLGARLVGRGLATADRRSATDYVAEEEAARDAKAGIWQAEMLINSVWLGRACEDFSTWKEAQDLYERSGPEDPYRLDEDKDGIACETLLRQQRGQGVWGWLFEDLNRLGNIAAIGAFLVTFVGAAVGIWGYCSYRWEFLKKQRKLEDYLRDEKRKAQEEGKVGQRSVLNITQGVGLTEDEILRISFKSSKIKRRAITNEKNIVVQLLFEYVAED